MGRSRSASVLLIFASQSSRASSSCHCNTMDGQGLLCFKLRASQVTQVSSLHQIRARKLELSCYSHSKQCLRIVNLRHFTSTFKSISIRIFTCIHDVTTCLYYIYTLCTYILYIYIHTYIHTYIQPYQYMIYIYIHTTVSPYQYMRYIYMYIRVCRYTNRCKDI